MSGRLKCHGLAMIAGAGMLLLANAPARARAQAQQGLALDEVLEMRRRGVSTRQILRTAQEFCIAFTVSDSAARVLRSAGAEEPLIDGLRQACSTVVPEERITPGMLLDVDFAKTSVLGGFSSDDGLCAARFVKNGLYLENRRRQGGCVIGYPSEPLDGAVRIELTVAGLGAQRPGSAILGFGRDGVEWNHYAFSVGTDLRAELCVNVDTGCRLLLSKNRVEAIATAPSAKNQLAVEVRGRVLQLSVNGHALGAYTAERPVRGGVVIGVGPMTKLVFEQLRARALTEASTTAAAARP